MAICFGLSINSGRAQGDSLKSSFHAGVNMLIPTGNFAATDFTQPTSGYARPGYGAEVGYSYRITKGLCVKANLSLAKNLINNDQLATQVKQLTEAQTGFSNLNSSSSESIWKNYFFHAGFSYQFWIGKNKKIGLEPEVLLGACYNVTPDVEYKTRIGNLSFETRNSSKGNFAFSHRESVKINYLLGNRTIAFVNLGYCGAMANVTGLQQIVIGNNTYHRSLNDYKINVALMAIGIGISTRF